MKRILAVLTLSLFLIPGFAAAQESHISAFVRDDCVHCQDAKEFFEDLDEEIIISYLDITEDENRLLFTNIAKAQNISQVTPIILVADQAVVGFDTAESTGAYITDLLDNWNNNPHESIEFFLTEQAAAEVGATCSEDSTECALPEKTLPPITIPLLGTIQPETYSLFTLSSLLGLVDGFNPCAMAVLVIFLTLLAQAGSKRRMLAVAGLFLVAEAVMYYFILTAWGTLWDFIGLQQIVTPLLGLLALGAGIYFLYRYHYAKNICQTMDPETEGQLMSKMRDISSKPLGLASALAIIGIAFSVNIIEFACSVGIPQTFTYILNINDLSFLAKHGYLALYIAWYMFDDLVVFALAIWAFNKLSQTQKYVRYSNLIGGLLMALLGLALLFSPDLLVF